MAQTGEGKSKQHLVGKVIGIVLAAAIVVALCVFGFFAFQYRDRFIDGTFINGMDVSRMTVQEAEEMIRKEAENYRFSLTFRTGETEVIDGEKIGYRFVSDGATAALMQAQNPLSFWRGRMGETSQNAAGTDTTYDKELLKKTVLSLPEFQEEVLTDPMNAYITWNGEDYVIVPETEGNRIDTNRVIQDLEKIVEKAGDAYSLSDEVYAAPAVRSDDSALNAQCAAANDLISCSITYLLPGEETVTIDKLTVIEWVIDDGEGGYILPDAVLSEQCEAFVTALAEQYRTYGTDTVFETTEKGPITVNLGKHGYEVDVEAETAALIEDILAHNEVTREPVWKYTGFSLAKDGIGTTYIEVDIASQHVYYYIDGELYLDTPCVTGTATDPERKTPPGLFTLSYKTVDVVLKGPIDPETEKPTYESPVKYWMPFNGNIGFHDADGWRSKYGGTIYRYAGSHGCINMPFSAAKKMYEAIDRSVPIILFGE